MAGHGTGYPISLRCGRCKVGRDWQHSYRDGMNLVRTGRTRPLMRSQQGHGHPRALMERHEYRCLDCGHVGWTRHDDILRKKLVP